jgi:hypothetical protein
MGSLVWNILFFPFTTGKRFIQLTFTHFLRLQQFPPAAFEGG